jgi:hypothetical protein
MGCGDRDHEALHSQPLWVFFFFLMPRCTGTHACLLFLQGVSCCFILTPYGHASACACMHACPWTPWDLTHAVDGRFCFGRPAALCVRDVADCISCGNRICDPQVYH